MLFPRPNRRGKPEIMVRRILCLCGLLGHLSQPTADRACLVLRAARGGPSRDPGPLWASKPASKASSMRGANVIRTQTCAVYTYDLSMYVYIYLTNAQDISMHIHRCIGMHICICVCVELYVYIYVENYRCL